MAANDSVLLLGASILLLLGHFARALRWGLLFPREQVRRFNLLLGLALGYTFNAILPWRIGEVLRAYFVSLRERMRLGYIGATVIAERLTDLIVVGLVAASLGAIAGNSAIVVSGTIMVAIAALLIAFAFLVRRSVRFRRLIWRLASIFNERVRFGIADLAWSYCELVAGGVIIRPRFVVATLGMWLLYSASYVTFGRVVDQDLPDLLYALLGTPLSSLIERLLDGQVAQDEILMSAFIALPLTGVLVYGLLRQWSTIGRLLSALRRYGGTPVDRTPPHTRNRFKHEGEYEYFLASLFSGDDHVVTGFGLRAIEDGIVHKLFNGGSDAITALVEVDDRLLIRKFALGTPAKKLKVQSDWLRAYKSRNLALVDILGEREAEEFYRYDMPLVVPSNDLYDVIHTTPIEQSEALIEEVASKVDDFHRQLGRPDASPETIDQYLHSKGIQNARKIVDFASVMLPSRDFTINGLRYSLDEWDRVLDFSWLRAQITDPRVAVIHGDLTIENIIVAPERKDGWYIIDPNPENIFDSPMIDWAKLMQSLHLGYESLNRGILCSLNENRITLALTKSYAYSTLHARLEAILEAQGGASRLREVYFHELMHYLRLTPYKIRQDPRKGLTFFASTSILLRRYLERIA